MTEASQLQELLKRARPTWNAKDVEAVQSKLRRVGVQNIPELLLELKANSLNESLRSFGEKRFCQSTLMALKKCANHWCSDTKNREPPLRKRRRPPEASKAPTVLQTSASAGASPEPASLEPSQNAVTRPLEELSDAELWTQYMSEGIAPPSFARKDLIVMLQAVRSWRSASYLELSQLCWGFQINASWKDTQEVLCQRLKNKTWEAWDIPIERFGGDMTAAYELLEHFQELEPMSLDQLMTLCHKKGLPIEGSPEMVPMKERLKLVALWERLPLKELEAECYRRGLPCAPVPLPGSQWPARNELLRILVQGLHREALARWLDGEESCADDELTSCGGGGEEEDGFLCLECHRWAQPDGEAAWVDGHRCCDDCAWRIYYEERAKAARLAEDDLDMDEAEVFEWMKTWRASRFLAHEGSEPAPEPPSGEEAWERCPEVTFTDSEGEATEGSLPGRSRRLVWQHFERQIQGLKDGSDSDAQLPCAWHVLAELPTDASEGEVEEPVARAEHWNFRQLWREEPSPCALPPRKAPCSAPTPPELAKVALAPEVSMAEGWNPPPTSLHACFCYASPLHRGLRELNVRAEWEALQAPGLDVEVRNGTSEVLHEVLLSKSRPEILHIAAHCAQPEDEGDPSIAVVLEGSDGAAQMLSGDELLELGWWDGIQLLVFLACSSQSLVQRLIQQRGLRRAVCCNAVVLDAASHVFCRAFYRALGAGQALRPSFEAGQAAIRRAFEGEAQKFVLLCASDGQWPLREALSLPPTLWPHWPRVEDYLGRESFTVSLANLFEHRRAVCLWGGRGSGKTALCLEFCRFFSAPGRRFSHAAFHITERQVACSSLLAVLLQQLGRGSDGSDGSDIAGGSVSSLLRAVREVDALRRPWLLVVDGFNEDLESSEMLSHLLAETTHLRLLLTARDPLHGQWAMGYSKVVDLPLPQLAPFDAARLLARRARRPFFATDFEGDDCAGTGLPGVPLSMGRELLLRLRESPVMKEVKGQPGQILAAAAMVGAELESLLKHPLVQV